MVLTIQILARGSNASRNCSCFRLGFLLLSPILITPYAYFSDKGRHQESVQAVSSSPEMTFVTHCH